MMDRTFDFRLNEIIVERRSMGGPRRRRHRHRRSASRGGRYDYAQIEPLVETARDAGLGVTIHVGGGEMGREEVGEVVERLRPDRIGHGILAGNEEVMSAIRDLGITLEICPTSNLLTKALPDEQAVRETIRSFVAHDVPFTIATDGPR